MPQALQSLSMFEFTPPASPTRLFGDVPRRGRTPSSVPLPPSPTKSHGSSNDERSYSLSAETSESSLTKVLKSLHKRTNTLQLQPKPLFPSLTSSPARSPQREVSRWPFRQSPACATPPTTPAAGLGDHFTRMRPTFEETQADMRRRGDASKIRVQKMREWLTTATTPTFHAAKAMGRPAKSHHRYDSGSHEHSENRSHYELPNPHTPEPSDADELEHLPHNTLCHSLFRLRNRTLRRFDCMGCGETHTDSLRDGRPAIWLLYGCRHLVGDTCLDKLRDQSTEDRLGDCHHCGQLRNQLGKMSDAEVERSHRRLLEVTMDVGKL